MDPVPRFEGPLPVGFRVGFKRCHPAARQPGRVFQNVLFRTSPAAPLVIVVEALHQGVLRQALRAQVQGGVHPQPFFVNRLGAVLSLEKLPHFFDEVRRGVVVPPLNVEAERRGLGALTLRLGDPAVIEHRQQHLIAALQGAIGMEKG